MAAPVINLGRGPDFVRDQEEILAGPALEHPLLVGRRLGQDGGSRIPVAWSSIDAGRSIGGDSRVRL